MSNFLAKMRATPIPEAMANNPRDKRGLPIPFIVLRDVAGKPHFQVNDDRKIRRCIRESLCSISGKHISSSDDKLHWLVGGPLSHLHMHGAFNDPPMLRACAEYALRVCPYIAMPNYNSRVDVNGMSRLDRAAERIDAGNGILIMHDPTMSPERPLLFGLGGYRRISTVRRPDGSLLVRAHERAHMSWWKDGEELSPEDSLRLLRRVPNIGGLVG